MDLCASWSWGGLLYEQRLRRKTVKGYRYSGDDLREVPYLGPFAMAMEIQRRMALLERGGPILTKRCRQWEGGRWNEISPQVGMVLEIEVPCDFLQGEKI